jgi:type I restriction enzyme, R subunit
VDRPIEELNEAEIRSRFILPALTSSGWDLHRQIREEYMMAAGRIDVRGSLATRRSAKRADYVLFTTPGVPLAVVEAKDATQSAGAGMQQAVDYAERLGAPFAFSSNGKAFKFQDLSSASVSEVELTMEEFPPPLVLRSRWEAGKQVDPEGLETLEEPFFLMGKEPRYYQLAAVNRTVEAIVRGKRRLLLVMATGTGKTFTAFQIIWRLSKAKRCERILYLADRNVLIDQAHVNDFKPFGQRMTKIEGHKVDPSYEVYLSLYQAVDGAAEYQKAYKEFSPDFFDLVIVDECHRGSAKEESEWREILDYFGGAVQIGMTATPKETRDASNIHYFGEPIYTYSLKQGIEDGYLAPYKVIRVDLDKDLQGWRPERGKRDKHGIEIEDRVFGSTDFDKTLILEKRTELVAAKVTEYLEGTDPYAKTIVFCVDQDHADRMRAALVNLNGERVAESSKYVMRITSDDKIGKEQLDSFINPEEKYPVIVTTSELLSTGVDVQTCKLIVLDQTIKSMTKFKQVIGRGTRVREEFGKLFFAIMDFRKATELFADPDFDGEPVVIFEPDPGESPIPPADPSGLGGEGEPVHTPSPPAGAEGEGNREPRQRYIVGDVDVFVVAERVQYVGPDGALITESLKDYTRKRVTEEFATLNDFLKHWYEGERKQAVIDELAERGVLFEALREIVGKDLSAFDLICHVVFDQPPLTRKQRADGVRASGYFAEYSDVARDVLEALLDKYADEGVEPDSGPGILKVKPFDEWGTVVELVGKFGGREQFDDAVRGLEQALYETETLVPSD